MRNQIPLDFKHLQERIKEFNDEDVSLEAFLDLLRQKLSTADIDNVKRDVINFTYVNDGYLKLGYGSVVTFTDTGGEGGNFTHHAASPSTEPRKA